MNTQIVLLYLLTWSLVALAPGPAVICVMTQASRYGLRPALAGIAGIQLGNLVFFGCVASGLAALLASASTAITLIRISGAIYLFYLGVRLILPARRVYQPLGSAHPPPEGRSLLLQGLAIEVTNPKVLLFMSALLPQFVESGRALPMQLAVLLAVTVAVHVVVLSGYAFLAQRGTQTLRARWAVVWLRRAAGGALIFFGIRLLAASRT
jgi:homoserine/homoserine lactone efflux protein